VFQSHLVGSLGSAEIFLIFPLFGDEDLVKLLVAADVLIRGTVVLGGDLPGDVCGDACMCVCIYMCVCVCGCL
jgi:hypothetical protein